MMYSSLRRISLMTAPSGEIVWPSNSEGFTRVILTGDVEVLAGREVSPNALRTTVGL
jgi:hypothetical protein